MNKVQSTNFDFGVTANRSMANDTSYNQEFIQKKGGEVGHRRCIQPESSFSFQQLDSSQNTQTAFKTEMKDKFIKIKSIMNKNSYTTRNPKLVKGSLSLGVRDEKKVKVYIFNTHSHLILKI
jgi:hypothetical protein